MLVLRVYMDVKQNLKLCFRMSFSGLLNIFDHDRDNAAHAFDVPKTELPNCQIRKCQSHLPSLSNHHGQSWLKSHWYCTKPLIRLQGKQMADVFLSNHLNKSEFSATTCLTPIQLSASVSPRVNLRTFLFALQVQSHVAFIKVMKAAWRATLFKAFEVGSKFSSEVRCHYFIQQASLCCVCLKLYFGITNRSREK